MLESFPLLEGQHLRRGPLHLVLTVRKRLHTHLLYDCFCISTFRFLYFRTGSDLLFLFNFFVDNRFPKDIRYQYLWSTSVDSWSFSIEIWRVQNRGEVVNWLFKVTINDISVIYVTAHRCAGGLKKLDLRSGSNSYRHFVGFFNVPVLAPTRDHPFYTVIPTHRPIKSLFTITLGIRRTYSRLNPPPGPHGGSKSIRTAI